MLIKNGRIIINEDSLEFEVKQLEKTLRKFFENDERFSKYDISVFVEFDNECWNDETHYFWNELNIDIYNYDKTIELGGQLTGQTRFASAHISYTTDVYEPQLVMNNGVPEFYYVFNGSSWTMTNSVTWENNRDAATIEDIVEELLKSFEVE